MAFKIADLRKTPKETCDKYGFLVKNSLFKGDDGGACIIKSTKLYKNVYQLEPTKGAGDWFFPYRQKVGSCVVPVGEPEGTIALTGGMNGCSLHVYKHGGSFYFYHDTNGAFLANMNPAGDRVCHVPYRSYAGPLEIGSNMAKELCKTNKYYVYFQHTLVCVKIDGRWKVFVTGIHSYGVTGKHSTFAPTLTSLITSFPDQ
ncbi:MAG: hypothetical protein K8R46_06715 [Pirellulales bacterium]|nr:hypothetical protein [Pirellulales bacterium]